MLQTLRKVSTFGINFLHNEPIVCSGPAPPASRRGRPLPAGGPRRRCLAWQREPQTPSDQAVVRPGDKLAAPPRLAPGRPGGAGRDDRHGGGRGK